MTKYLSKDWEAHFLRERAEAQYRAQVARDYWALSDEERREGHRRRREVCWYDPVEDAILRRTERDPMEQASEDRYELSRHDWREW